MSVLDWLFVGLLSSAILFFIASLLSLLFRITYTKKYRRLSVRRPKNRKKQKRWKRACFSMKRKSKKALVSIILFLSAASLFALGAFYTRYYQLTNLNANDGEIIVQSYFLIDSLEKELLRVKAGASPEKSQSERLNMTSLLVSYGSQPPSTGLSIEGQQLLKRYYSTATDFGKNLHSQSVTSLERKDTVQQYLNDIKELKTKQQQIFKQFKVNESALKHKT